MLSSASAEVVYATTVLLSSPQPAYDLSQSRPALRLRRSPMGVINDVGQLTGTGDAGLSSLSRDARPFFYDPVAQTTANLGDLSGDFADPAVLPRNDASKGLGLNDGGWVVGVSSTSTTAGVVDDRPFVWIDEDQNHARNAGEMRELALNPGATYGSALRINNSNRVLIHGDTGLYLARLQLSAGVLSETAGRVWIAGAADLADLNDAGDVAYLAGSGGYVWRDLNGDDTATAGEVTAIPRMSPASTATAVYAINNAGQVAGTMRNEHNKEVAFIWTDLDGDNQVDWLDVDQDGYFDAEESSGEVVRFHGSPQGLTAEVGNTYLFDVNDLGQAVGSYFDGTDRFAFIYDPALGMRYLKDLVDPSFALDLREADAINNLGTITAIGREVAYPSTIDSLVVLRPLAGAIEGDLDGDGFVGISDLDILLGHWNQTVPAGDPGQGDPSADGYVGIEDLDLVLGNWNRGTPSGAGSIFVPEPSVIGLLGVGGLRLLGRRDTTS